MSRNKHSKNRRNQGGAQGQRNGRTGQQTRNSGQQAMRTGQGNQAQDERQEASSPQNAMMKRVSDLKTSVGSEISSDIERASGAMRGAQQRAGEIATEARDMMVRASESTMRTIKENPVPVAMAGIGIVCAGAGLTWLVLSSGGRAAKTLEAGEEMPPITDRMQKTMKSAGKGVKQAGRAAGEKVSQLAHEASAQTRRVEQAVEGAVSEHPLVVGAALLAAGTAIGLALPRTKLENGWLGRERDHLVQVAQTAAKGAVDKVGSLARQALSANNANHAQA
jgi:hypothetical protein